MRAPFLPPTTAPTPAPAPADDPMMTALFVFGADRRAPHRAVVIHDLLRPDRPGNRRRRRRIDRYHSRVGELTSVLDRCDRLDAHEKAPDDN